MGNRQRVEFMGRRFTIRGKAYTHSDDLPAEVRALLDDTDARDLPELMELMENMSDESFSAFLKDLPGSSQYPTSAAAKQSGGSMFPEIKPLDMAKPESSHRKNDRPGSVQEELERMQRAAKHPKESEDDNQQLLLEPEGEEQAETRSQMPSLPLDIEEEEEHQTSFSVATRRKIFAKELSLDLSEDTYDEAEEQPDKEKHIKLDTSLIHTICRCGFKRNMLPEDYHEGLRCPHCFRVLKRGG